MLLQPELLHTFWRSVAQLNENHRVILVHGAGPQATAMAKQLGHVSRKVHGRRITTGLDLDILKWTARGAINLQLVTDAQRQKLTAVGLSGADGQILQVTKRPPWQIDGEMVDFGWVGDVLRADTTLLSTVLDQGFLPIIAPLGVDSSGQLFNVNADTVAGAIARAMQASHLFLVTDSGGVRKDVNDPSSLIAQCNSALFREGQEEGWIEGGMRVKLTVAFDALDQGVSSVFVIAPDDLLQQSYATQVTH